MHAMQAWQPRQWQPGCAAAGRRADDMWQCRSRREAADSHCSCCMLPPALRDSNSSIMTRAGRLLDRLHAWLQVRPRVSALPAHLLLCIGPTARLVLMESHSPTQRLKMHY